MTQIIIPTPDDMHLHVRQGARMTSAVGYAVMHFGRAIIMPNTMPHTVTVAQAQEYREQILMAVPKGTSFEPLMTLSLKPETTPEIIREAKASGFIHGVKLYAGHTTNSAGFEDVKVFYSALAEMEKQGLPLLIHGEAASHIDVFDREKVFYENTLPQIKKDFPGLRIVCEHITTRTACQFVLDTPTDVVATITPQHLLVNRNYMLGGGLRPDAYCMPILKREEDRVALVAAATSGNPKFFLGTDSAPHAMFGEPGKAKYAACGCAGSFTSPVALALYAEVFDSVNALDKLADFASRFGREFYGLPANQGQIILTREPVSVDPQMEFGETQVPVFRAEQPLQWKVTRESGLRCLSGSLTRGIRRGNTKIPYSCKEYGILLLCSDLHFDQCTNIDPPNFYQKTISYSHTIIPPNTIGWAAFFCPEQARRSSAIPESCGTSGLSVRDHSPLRDIVWIGLVSVFESEAKESSTLEISSPSRDLRDVSLARCAIGACVSDIFVYNSLHYIKSMSKIKEIIEKMGMRGISYPDAQLLVAKRVWLIIVSLYYLSVLFTVGGFYFTISIPGIEPHTVSIAELSLVQFHLYSVLIVATAWFTYALVEYGQKVYLNSYRWTQVTAGILLSIVTISILLIHLGVIQTLLH